MKKLEFGMFGAGFAVAKSGYIDDSRYYPNPKKKKQIKKWLRGFNMAYADYPSHLSFEECLAESVKDKKLANKLIKFDRGKNKA